MSASTTLPGRFGPSSPFPLIWPSRIGANGRALAKCCAAAILLAALLAPTCCLNGAHAHGGDADGFGAICLGRAVLR